MEEKITLIERLKSTNPKIILGALAIAIFVFVGGIIAFQSSGSFLAQNQDTRSRAGETQCPASSCPDGWSFGAGGYYGTCDARRTEACRNHQGGSSSGSGSSSGGSTSTRKDCNSGSHTACVGKKDGDSVSYRNVSGRCGFNGYNSSRQTVCGWTPVAGCRGIGQPVVDPNTKIAGYCCSGKSLNGVCVGAGTTAAPTPTVSTQSCGYGSTKGCLSVSKIGQTCTYTGVTNGRCTNVSGHCECISAATPTPVARCQEDQRAKGNYATCCSGKQHTVNGLIYCGVLSSQAPNCTTTTNASLSANYEVCRNASGVQTRQCRSGYVYSVSASGGVGSCVSENVRNTCLTATVGNETFNACLGGSVGVTQCVINRFGLKGVCAFENSVTRNCRCQASDYTDCVSPSGVFDKNYGSETANTRTCSLHGITYTECNEGFVRIIQGGVNKCTGSTRTTPPCGGYGTATACNGRQVDSLCNGYTKDYYCRQTGSADDLSVCACQNATGGVGGPDTTVTSAAGQCSTALQSCDTTPCCGGQNLSCQGTTGNRKCQQTAPNQSGDSWCKGDNNENPSGACTSWYGFKCSKLTNGQCTESPSGPLSSESDARAYAGSACGQVDQVCNSSSGARAGKLCGSFEVINRSCNTETSKTVVTETAVPGMCTSVNIWALNASTGAWEKVAPNLYQTRIVSGSNIRISTTGTGRAFQSARFAIKAGEGEYGPWVVTSSKMQGEYYINYRVPTDGVFEITGQLL